MSGASEADAARREGASAGRAAAAGAYRVAACQFEPRLFDVAANLAKMEELARRAAAAGARLAVFPECCLCGYAIGKQAPRMAAFAEVALGADRGPSVRRLEALSAALDLQLVFGMPERSDGVVYNSAVHVRPLEGAVAADRKIHLWEDDTQVFAPGEGAAVHAAPAGRLASLVCYDLEFPEAARVAALEGADLIAVCTADMSPHEHYQHVFARARAMENCVFVAVANCLGESEGTVFYGRSIITDPLGTVLAEAESEETVLVAEVDLSLCETARRELHYEQSRRPQTYGPLTET